MRLVKYHLCVFLFFTNTAFAQTIIPANKSFKINKTIHVFDFKRTFPQDDSNVKQAFIYDSLGISKRFKLERKIVERRNQKNMNQVIDSLRNVYLDSLYELQIPSIVNQLNSSPPIKPIITAGLANLENTSQSYGNLSIGLLFRLSKYKVGKRNWIDPHFLYTMFSARTATSPDSSSIQKTFMFPELNKRDFVLGYFFEKISGDWSFAPTFEFSFNKFSDTSNSKNFVSQSFITGLRIQKALTTTSTINSFVALYPYYSLITVEKKYSIDYRDLIGEPQMPSTFHSFGLHVSAQATNAILFCNMKYIFGRSSIIKSPDLKTFIYTIGTQVAL
jgi:hypothetical protein